MLPDKSERFTGYAEFKREGDEKESVKDRI